MGRNYSMPGELGAGGPRRVSGPLLPLSVARLADGTTDRLRSAILDGTLAAGERLVESGLAVQLQVSRAPIREALRRLEFEELVTTLPRRGRYVRVLSPHDAWEVYTLREALEVIAIEKVVVTRGSEVIRPLGDVLAEMRSAVSDSDRVRLAQLDVKFHRLICEAAGHQRLVNTWDSMLNQIRLLSLQVLETQYNTLEDVWSRHQLLIDAIASGDRARAASTIRSHIESVGLRVVNRLNAQRLYAGSATAGESSVAPWDVESRHATASRDVPGHAERSR